MIRKVLVAVTLLVALIALWFALAPADVAPAPTPATSPIVIEADDMADVLIALDLKPVEIVNE